MREIANPKPVRNGRVKAGNGQDAVAERRNAFIQAYLANGHNATKAAIVAGFSPKTAYSTGQRMLKHVEISQELAAAAEQAASAACLTTAKSLREVARISTSDIRNLYREDGTIKNVTEMDDDTVAAIASIDIQETKEEGAAVGRTTKVRLWDKNRALEMAMKHLGLFERDNGQRGESIQIRVVLE